MHKYRITLTYGTFFVIADYYSIVDDKYQFWVGTKVIVQYPGADVVKVETM